MSVHEDPSGWRVKWREGDRQRSRKFSRKRDAEAWDAEVKRRRQLGPLAVAMMGGRGPTLDDYVADAWAGSHLARLAPRTRKSYASVYRTHIAEPLGPIPLREITPATIRQWHEARQDAGVGIGALRRADAVLSSILQHAAEHDVIGHNPKRSVRRPKARHEDRRQRDVAVIAPARVEAMRSAMLAPEPVVINASRPGQRKRKGYVIEPRPERERARDAVLVSLLAYAGLRPGEALDLRWRDVGERTIRVHASKTGRSRSVRILAPLASDLDALRRMTDDGPDAPIFPGPAGDRWTDEAYKSWARRTFAAAAKAAGCAKVTPYGLRHSFASLLLHEGRSIPYVAAQLGHSPAMTGTVYAHVLAELEDAPMLPAEDAIAAARGVDVPSEFPEGAMSAEA